VRDTEETPFSQMRSGMRHIRLLRLQPPKTHIAGGLSSGFHATLPATTNRKAPCGRLNRTDKWLGTTPQAAAFSRGLCRNGSEAPYFMTVNENCTNWNKKHEPTCICWQSARPR
jgi:hypothetical protein